MMRVPVPGRHRRSAVRAIVAVASATLHAFGCERADLGPAPVATVEVSAPPGVLERGDEARLAVTLKDAHGRTLSDRSVLWSSGDTTLVVVDPEGVARVVADPPEARAVEVRATSEGVVGSASLNIGSIPAERVEIVPGSDSLYVGESTTLRAIVYAADGRVLDRPVRWSSGNPATLTVDSTGTATAVGNPPAFSKPVPVSVEARVGDVADTVEIFPLPPVLRVIAWGSERIRIGRKVEFWALAATYAERLPGSAGPMPVRWTSSDSSVVTVDAYGGVTAKGLGTAFVRAEANRKSDTVHVRVVDGGYGVTYLGTLGGDLSAALDLNDAGQVVGNASTARGDPVAFLWESGAMRQLPMERFRSTARAESYGSALINNRGQVAGWADLDVPDGGRVVAINDAADYVVAVGRLKLLLYRGGKVTVLPTESVSEVFGFNSRGDAGGYDDRTATVWLAGELPRIEGVGYSVEPGGFSVTAINDAGLWISTAFHGVSYSYHSFIGLPGGSPPNWGSGGVELGPECASHCSTFAYDLNEANQVVGRFTLGAVGNRVFGSLHTGFIWQNGALSDLTDLLVDPDWVITEARAINERGEIAGSGRNLRTGESGAVLLRPVQWQP